MEILSLEILRLMEMLSLEILRGMEILTLEILKGMEIWSLEFLRGMEMPGRLACLAALWWALGLQQLCRRTKTGNKLRHGPEKVA